MPRLARVEVFASDEVAIVHVLNRTVRRCVLLGNNPVSGKNFDHCMHMDEIQPVDLVAVYWETLVKNSLAMGSRIPP